MNPYSLLISWLIGVSLFTGGVWLVHWVCHAHVSSAKDRFRMLRFAVYALPLVGCLAWLSKPRVLAEPPRIESSVPTGYVTHSTANSVTSEPSGPWIPLVLGLYGVGFLGLLGITAVRYRRLHHMVQNAVPVSTEPTVVVVPDEIPPLSCGIRQHVIVMARSVMKKTTESQRELIYRHESIHIERRDHLLMLYVNLLSTVMWFHPVWWLVRQRLIEEMELACDEEVLAFEVEPHTYGELLVQLALHLTPEARPVIGGTYFNKSFLLRRVQAMQVKKSRPLSRGVLALLVAGFVGGSWAVAQTHVYDRIDPAVQSSMQDDADVGLVFEMKINMTGNRNNRIGIRANLAYGEVGEVVMDELTLTYEVTEDDGEMTVHFDLVDIDNNSMEWNLRGVFGDEQEIELSYPDAPMGVEEVKITLSLDQPFEF